MVETEKEERHKLREHFLASFVQSMIMNSYKEVPKTEQQKAKEKEFREAIEEVKRNLQKTKKEVHEASPIDTSTFMPPRPIKMPTRNEKRPNIPIKSPVPLPTYQPLQLKPGEKPDTLSLGKLAQVLKDPAVFSVEVPGPAKNVRVNRAGQIQTSSLILTKDEIQKIMDNISEKTRIPLMSGLFKAAVQDLLITAVISEFVGTRMMIQKRTPFQPVQ